MKKVLKIDTPTISNPLEIAENLREFKNLKIKLNIKNLVFFILLLKKVKSKSTLKKSSIIKKLR